MKILGVWALSLVVGFIAMAYPTTDRLADRLVNKLIALDNRQLAVCLTRCEFIHKGITEFIATIQKAKHDGNKAGLRRLEPLVYELEAAMIPELRFMEEIRAKVQPAIERTLR